MTILGVIAGANPVEGHRPWPRAVVDQEGWGRAIGELVAGRWTLSGLWGDARAVHMAVIDEAGGIAVLTYECRDGRFPSVGAKHPPAVRLERAICSLFGHEPIGGPDIRPWLDHGVWDVTHPLGDDQPVTIVVEQKAYDLFAHQRDGVVKVAITP